MNDTNVIKQFSDYFINTYETKEGEIKELHYLEFVNVDAQYKSDRYLVLPVSSDFVKAHKLDDEKTKARLRGKQVLIQGNLMNGFGGRGIRIDLKSLTQANGSPISE